MKKYSTAILIVLLVLFFDQGLKIYIKLTMIHDTEFKVFGDWFRIHFLENEGMAFGLTLGGEYGKLILSLFRIAAVFFIGIYLSNIIQSKSPKGLIISISLILAGALGNIIDSTFYGMIFTDSHGRIAEFLPEHGYAPIFHGKVVDMLWFPIIKGQYPDWVPFIGGDHYRFFQPVFNIADAAITIGVFMIIIFQKQYFRDIDEEIKENQLKPQKDEDETTSENNIEGTTNVPPLEPTT